MSILNSTNICNIDQINNDIHIKNNLCKPMLNSICAKALEETDNELKNEITEYAVDYYKKCIDQDANRNEFKDINNIKYKYDKIKQQNIDNNLRKKSNELFNYLIVFFIILFFVILFIIIKFFKF